MSEYIHRASFVPMMSHAGRIKGRIRYRTYFDAVAKMLPTTEFVGDVLPLWVSALGSKEAAEGFLGEFFFTRSAPQPRTPWMNSTLLTISQSDDFETRFNWFFAGAREDAELLTHASVTNEQYASALLFALCFPDIMPAMTTWWIAENPTDLFRLADIAMSGIPPQDIPAAYENDVDVDLISSFIAGEGKS
jgi:hypothetical protein